MDLIRHVVLIFCISLSRCDSFQTSVPHLGGQCSGSSCRSQPLQMAVANGNDADALPMTQSWDPKSYQKNAAFVAELGSPVIDLLAPQAGERVLDLGCGDGALTVKLAERGCKVVGIDASADQVAGARERDLEAYVMDGADIRFQEDFDAVFSNAALHWMPDADAVISGVKRVLKPRGRFVAEFGGHGNVFKIRSAMERVLQARGIDGAALNPWFFPTVEEYRARLTSAGFNVDTIELIDRPTELPGDVVGWLRTFGENYIRAVPEEEQEEVLHQVRELLRPGSMREDGVWIADYVRLRFAARLI